MKLIWLIKFNDEVAREDSWLWGRRKFYGAPDCCHWSLIMVKYVNRQAGDLYKERDR